jgi:hypothetical protein
MFNFKSKATAKKPKSKTREWIDAIVYGIFSPRFRPAPKFKPGVVKPAPPKPPEE